MLPILATTVLSFLPQAPGNSVQVTDALSHGTLGDNLLSFDEAIRLCNGTLSAAQLSPAEAANITGTAAFVDHIVIDPTITLNIFVQAPLTPITGAGLGPITVEGILIPGPPGTDPTMTLVLGGTSAYILALRTHEVEVRGLHFDSGQVAVDVFTQTSGQVHGQMAMLEDCDLHGQTSAGIRVLGQGTAHSGLMLHHVHFHSMSRGILVDDQSAGGWVMMEAEHCHMDQVALACDVVENGTGGDMSMAMFFRSEIAGGANFLRVRRAAASNQQFMTRIVHCDVQTSGDCVDVQGNGQSLTMVHHHHTNLTAGAGAKAMFVWPRTAVFDFHGSEMQFTGDVSVAANLFSQRVWQQNNRYRNGTITFDVDSSLPNLLWNHYENCSIVVPGAARTQLRVRSCELVNTNVTGQSLVAPITLENCWRSGGVLTGQVTEPSPAPTRYLATAEVTPTEPVLGSTVDLIADTPPNIALAWVLSTAIDRPNTATEPFRFYGDPTTLEVMLIVTGQSTTTVPVPTDVAFVGLEFYVAAATFAVPSLPYVPEFLLPRGGLVRPIL